MQRCFDQMSKTGLKPNMVTYNALIKAYARKADSEGASEWFREAAEGCQWLPRTALVRYRVLRVTLSPAEAEARRSVLPCSCAQRR